MDKLIVELLLFVKAGGVKGADVATHFGAQWPRLVSEADGLIDQMWHNPVDGVPRATDWTVRVTLVGELFLSRHS